MWGSGPDSEAQKVGGIDSAAQAVDRAEPAAQKVARAVSTKLGEIDNVHVFETRQPFG